MSHLRGRPRFLPEAAPADCVSFEFANYLERHDPLQPLVLGLVYHAHSAFANHGENSVRTDTFGDFRDCHLRMPRLAYPTHSPPATLVPIVRIRPASHVGPLGGSMLPSHSARRVAL